MPSTSTSAPVRRSARARGFSFIEILIVMGIVSMLVGGVIVAINIWGRRGPEFATRQTVAVTSTLVQAWRSRFETYPPTDVKDLLRVAGLPGEPIRGGSNSTNRGIESLWQAFSMPGFKSEHSWADSQIGNTDDDRLPKAIATSGIAELREILDAWGNPLIYFHNADYATADGAPHVYTMGAEPSDFYAPGDEVDAIPHRDADGQFRNPNTYQVFSMGPDGRPNTEDDIGNWSAE